MTVSHRKICKSGSHIPSQHCEGLQELYVSADKRCLENSYNLFLSLRRFYSFQKTNRGFWELAACGIHWSIYHRYWCVHHSFIFLLCSTHSIVPNDSNSYPMASRRSSKGYESHGRPIYNRNQNYSSTCKKYFDFSLVSLSIFIISCLL